MKNSLFKRAFAAVATVPLALTQCLSIANAVNVNDNIIISTKTAAPAENEYSVETIRYIDPTEDDGAMYTLLDEVYEGDGLVSLTYTKKSYWNSSIGAALDAIEGKAPSDTIDLTPVFDEAVSKAGKYADVAKNVVSKIGNATYTVKNRTVTVEASLDNIAPVFEDFAQSKVSAEFKELSEKYNMDEFNDIKFFKDINISGKFVIEIETVNGAEDRTLTGKVTFTDETGKVWNDVNIADYFTEKLDELQNSAVSTINELLEKYDLTDEELEKLVQDSQEYKDLIQNLKNGYVPDEGEIETMIIESVEFQNLVADYMAKNGVDYAVAEAAVKESDDFNELLERFNNGINLSDEEIKDILHNSDDYNKLVENYMADNAVSYDDAVNAVLQSAEYQALVEKYTDKYTYTDEEIEAMVKGSADYQKKMSDIRTEYADTYDRMSAKAESTKTELQNLVSKAKSYMTKGINKYYDVKDYTGSYHFDNYADMARAINNNELFNKALDYVNDKAPDKITDKLPDSIPEDLDVIAQNQKIQNAFVKIVNQISSKVDGVTINLAPEDITSLVESIENIDLAANAGVVTFNGELPDNEDTDAISYVIDTYGNDYEGYEFVVDGSSSHKEADVEIDFNSAGSASATFELNRIVEIKVQKKELTTTTTDVTTTVDPTVTTTVDPTVTTTSDNGSGSVTTTSDNGSGAVTTTSDNGSGAVTTTSDNGSGAVTTTSDNGSGAVTTTSDNGSGAVTTTSDNGSGAVTTTSDNGSGAVTTTSDNGSGSVTTTSDNGSGAVTTTSDNGSGSVTTTSDNGSGSVTTTSDNGSGLVTTTSSDIVIVGTTTVSAELVSVEVSVETVDGFYLSIDKKFNEEQVQSLTYSAVVRHVITDEADNIIKDTSEVVKGDLMGKFKFDDTPESVFTPVADGEKATIDNFKYTVALYAAEDIVDGDVTIFAANDAIATTGGGDATINAAINAYIGVKGDANLSGKSLSDDASVVLTWYATASTGGNESVAFTTSPLAVDEETGEIIDATLDRFAAFLADTDNENNPDNWKSDVLKTKRQVSAADASFILGGYSLASTGVDTEYLTREQWNEVLGDTFAKVED